MGSVGAVRVGGGLVPPTGAGAGCVVDGDDAMGVGGVVVRVRRYALVAAITVRRATAAMVERRTGHAPADSKSLLTIVTARPDRSAPVMPPRTQFLPDTA